MTAAMETTGSSLALDVLLGDWRNTNAAGRIARIICRPAASGRMTVQCHGRTAEGMRDWGAVDAPIYSFTFESREAGAFSAVVDHGFEEVHLQANVKSGVLVVASFNRIKDGSLSSYFDREFFHRVGEG